MGAPPLAFSAFDSPRQFPSPFEEHFENLLVGGAGPFHGFQALPLEGGYLVVIFFFGSADPSEAAQPESFPVPDVLSFE